MSDSFKNSKSWGGIPCFRTLPANDSVHEDSLAEIVCESAENEKRAIALGNMIRQQGLTTDVLPYSLCLLSDPDAQLRGTVLATIIQAATERKVMLTGEHLQLLCRIIRTHAIGKLYPWGLAARYKLADRSVQREVRRVIESVQSSDGYSAILRRKLPVPPNDS